MGAVGEIQRAKQRICDRDHMWIIKSKLFSSLQKESTNPWIKGCSTQTLSWERLFTINFSVFLIPSYSFPKVKQSLLLFSIAKKASTTVPGSHAREPSCFSPVWSNWIKFSSTFYIICFFLGERVAKSSQLVSKAGSLAWLQITLQQKKPWRDFMIWKHLQVIFWFMPFFFFNKKRRK